MYKFYLSLLLITFLISQSYSQVYGCQRVKQLKSILRGNNKNVISYENGSLLASRKQNLFNGSGKSTGILFRNEIYENSLDLKGTYCSISYSLIINLRQNYELNNLILWLWDGETRYYNLIVYAIYSEKETIIFDSVSASAIVHIKFPVQIVQLFRIYNRNGNTSSQSTNIVKVEAFYRV
ncbi:unnamed protein product (macronuclear) [Paramecium tetraurelia]|uniref:NADH:ubiquinone oxidoreductase intermediate-associated protein 30 domain-containing protein n=1 Tax=Paramecium tetraurelia TaxID=5888 RepID=A0C5I2_PARTE|nr:uncharacterized protein GSPATT00006548001 [Paramecium tetraurelia]CAK66049.1 unnamed protein product [Paramecium tetraurelia]|eukprot:XP_001433446.1 hypothetical protein (macronuclear) [Paramecium tetraurelia strain d4-2]